MVKQQKKIRTAVRRDHAERYILISLISFSATVIFTRAFLEITGYPQIGNDILHFAHALWGGLLLAISALLPLAFANRWAIEASAYLSGIGIGLFIDEVGKFITQTNDYFFPAALPLIYGFILLNVFIYLYIRRPREEDPRKALYNVFDGLKDALDGDLDSEEEARIETQLAVAMRSDRTEINTLATMIRNFLRTEKQQLVAVNPGLLKRIQKRIDSYGLRLGRQKHRFLIIGLLVFWFGMVANSLIDLIQGGINIDGLALEWRTTLIILQGIIGIIILIAVITWGRKKEEIGLKISVAGFLLSLLTLQTLYFYISQFSAIFSTLLQLFILQTLFAYGRWYLGEWTLLDIFSED